MDYRCNIVGSQISLDFQYQVCELLLCNYSVGYNRVY